MNETRCLNGSVGSECGKVLDHAKDRRSEFGPLDMRDELIDPCFGAVLFVWCQFGIEAAVDAVEVTDLNRAVGLFEGADKALELQKIGRVRRRN